MSHYISTNKPVFDSISIENLTYRMFDNNKSNTFDDCRLSIYEDDSDNIRLVFKSKTSYF